MELKLAPSILTADFARLGPDLQSVSEWVDWFHLDVMDGHYVENITFRPTVVEAIRKVVDQPLHVHLMISDPPRYVEWFARVGADRISFHPEVVEDVRAVIDQIRAAGAQPGLAVHPDVGIDRIAPFISDIAVVLMMTVRPGFGGQSYLDHVTPKIAEARALVEKTGSDADIEVDGGINLTTVDRAVHAGAEIVVAGSAIFDGRNPPAAARRMRERLEVLRTGK
ncbi:MAG: ribulose-phosphate 3-epimerase [Actinomycetota bacterium]|nr:ribulose-phosphate 3-epimerase [Actinomycetota bacterium]